ncbi:Lrp/AsnC family transcriptional regulator [Streptomyces phaeochromogenes]
MDRGPKSDESDLALIRALQINGRVTFRELEDASGLPYSSTLRRVRVLMESGLLRILALENPLRAGSKAQAGVGLVINGPVDPVREALLTLPEVEFGVLVSGSYDLLLDVSCADKGASVNLVDRHLRTILGVVRVEPWQYLDVLRLPYAWAGIDIK